MRDESEIQNYLELEGKKHTIDERMVSNETMRKEAIANGKDTNGEDYTAECQELFQKKSDIKTKTEALLKSGDAGAI